MVDKRMRDINIKISKYFVLLSKEVMKYERLSVYVGVCVCVCVGVCVGGCVRERERDRERERERERESFFQHSRNIFTLPYVSVLLSFSKSEKYQKIYFTLLHFTIAFSIPKGSK